MIIYEIYEEKNWKYLIIVSQDPVEAQFKNGIQHLYWENFFLKKERYVISFKNVKNNWLLFSTYRLFSIWIR